MGMVVGCAREVEREVEMRAIWDGLLLLEELCM
jgi:hypothetical protein